jgi:two-component system chemotaxis response regulator CheB
MRVLLVDDSALVRSILKERFRDDAEISVVGEAVNGERAISEVRRLLPDLVIMDVNMPVLDGIEATERIMREYPVPIFIFSSEVDAGLGYRACQAGAVDVMRKPDIGRLNDDSFFRDFRELLLSVRRDGGAHARMPPHQADDHPPGAGVVRIVVMGASTGGPLAVRTILSALPGGTGVPLALVQHLEEGFEGGYVDWLGEATELDVKLVTGEVMMQPATVYVAPSGRHLLAKGLSLVLDDGPPVLNQRPSVNRLFSTAADSHGNGVLGVLLTGMGTDGAEGCRDIVRRGGTTIVEDRSTAAIFGMPRAAIEMNAATQVAPLPEIAGAILTRLPGQS